MYLNIFTEKLDNDNTVIHLWDDEKGYSKFKYAPYAYKLDRTGTYTTIFGDRAKKVTTWSYNDIEQGNIYESDLQADIRTLIDLYKESDTPSDKHIIGFIDIEVDSTNGFPHYKNPINELTAIALYDTKTQIKKCFIVDPLGKCNKTIDNKSIVACTNEVDMITKFLKYWQGLNLTIVTGWNNMKFDMPYLYARINEVLGEQFANKLSPISLVKMHSYNAEIEIAGISILDYMELYKQFTANEEPSYSLENISQKELGRGKIKYDGTLDQLFANDINKFIDYNLNDIELIMDMDDKLKFIDLAISLCHKGHTSYKYISTPSVYIDGAFITFTSKLDLVVPNGKKVKPIKLITPGKVGDKRLECIENIDIDVVPKTGILVFQKSKSKKLKFNYINYNGSVFELESPLPEFISPSWEVKIGFEGAFVKEPIPGKYKDLYDLDLVSMYPSNIMNGNISPETKRGRVLGYNQYEFRNAANDKKYIVFLNKQEKKMTKAEIVELIKTKNYSLLSNGTMYDMTKPGIIPSILEAWFAERDEYKTLMKKYKKAGDKYLGHLYYLKQYTQKILLNTFYGVMGLATYRFHDIDNADAVTSVGRELIKFSSLMLNEWYKDKMEIDGTVDATIYVDTDSCFSSAHDLINKFYPNLIDKDERNQKVIEFATEAQAYINESYDYYAPEFLNITNRKWRIKQELVATNGLLIAKKRYALRVTNKEGVPCDELDVKGIDVVRSNFPKKYRSFCSGLLDDILDDKDKAYIDKKMIDFKTEMINMNFDELMVPTGIHEIEDFMTDDLFNHAKGTPAHVKAALNYNGLLKYKNITTAPPLKSDDKIKWTYIRKNEYNLDSIAIKGDGNDPEFIIDFCKTYIDKTMAYEKLLKTKINDFYSALGWGEITDNPSIDAFFNFD